MNLFKRTKSTSKHNGSRSELSSTSSSSSMSSNSSRQPLVPQTNIDLPSTPPPSGDQKSYSSSVAGTNGYDTSPSKAAIGKKIAHRDTEDSTKARPSQMSSSRQADPQPSRGLGAPPRISSRSTKPTYTNSNDMYTHNDLNTFTFGAAPSSSSRSSSRASVDPLSRPCDETDSDEVNLIPDTTPRPSVVGSQHPRSHQSQISALDEWEISMSPTRLKPTDRVWEEQERDSDAASTHTFGTSSFSSHSRPSGSNSRATSRASGRSTTPQTSGNDLTSDEEDIDGRHPLPPEPRNSRSPPRFPPQDQESTLYLSEEEFDGYIDDFDNDNDGIEIDSVIHEGSEVGFDREDFMPAGYSQRRGSAAMPIPNTPSDRSYVEHREREDSIATLRRPSRSLDELHSFSFAHASSSSSAARSAADPPAPTSVPESEGDWRDLRKRSVQRDKDLPPIVPSKISASNTDALVVTTNGIHSASTTNALEFNTSWIQQYGVNGVVGFEIDDMTDIVGPGGRRPSGYSFRKGSTASAFRRQSTVSSNIDMLHKNIQVWGNERYQDQRKLWRFVRENDRIEDFPAVSRTTTVAERERGSITTLFTPRPSITADPSVNAIAPFLDGPGPSQKDKNKAPKEQWRGMALNSEEIWFNPMSGKYRVNRKNAITPDVHKPPQQRLNITYMRSPYISNATNRDAADGPAVTIHKHSKATGFSISRHYRTKSQNKHSSSNPTETTISLRNPSSSRHVATRDSDDAAKKKSSMILLATRKVQKAYTSTNTTRKLESHGLLDDHPSDAEKTKRERERERPGHKEIVKDSRFGTVSAPERVHSDRSKGKSKDVEQRTKDNGYAAGSSKKAEPSKAKSRPLPESSEGSSGGSSGSVSSPNGVDAKQVEKTATSGTSSNHSDNTSSFGSVDQSVHTGDTHSSDRTISQETYGGRRRSIMDDLDDDSGDERRRYPSRTPYRETYAALPPEVFESAHQENPSHGIFGWGKSRGGDRNVNRANAYLEASYNPPWPVTATRFNSETRRGIVDDLNMSFQDVGLLPAIGEIKGGHSGNNKKKKEQQVAKPVKDKPNTSQKDIFAEVPEDSLYMLLPLWPGETDPNSAKKYPYTPPSIETQSRQYLLVYYKTPPPPVPREEVSNGKTKAVEKKRSRISPTSSHESNHKAHEHGVLLTTFHISARIVSYHDMQGTGVRIPDIGLAVSGPLQDAYDYISTCEYTGDYVIGVCDSRASGIEFLPEGFDKVGLSRSIPNPRMSDPSEDDDSSSLDSMFVLTPMGRAVMEMAWLGGMAVTSFIPNSGS